MKRKSILFGLLLLFTIGTLPINAEEKAIAFCPSEFNPDVNEWILQSVKKEYGGAMVVRDFFYQPEPQARAMGKESAGCSARILSFYVGVKQTRTAMILMNGSGRIYYLLAEDGKWHTGPASTRVLNEGLTPPVLVLTLYDDKGDVTAERHIPLLTTKRPFWKSIE